MYDPTGCRELYLHIADGGDMPVIEILGPADLREPDAERVRVAI